MTSVLHLSRRVPLPCSVTYHASPFRMFPPVCLAVFWSLITLLALSSAPVYAEWVAVERDYFLPGQWMIYIDPDTIQREGNLVTVWQLADFKTMQGGRSPTRFLSAKTHKQFACAEKRFRLLAFTEFTDGMGTGIPDNGYVDKDNWLPVKPESVSQALWEVVCGKK